MAKFSQAFLQGLLQPTYGQGLFTAARELGEMPGRIREEERQLAEVAKFKTMTPEQQFDFDGRGELQS